jgi:hypothetical protein
MAGIMVWAVWQERNWIREFLAEEVGTGLLTSEQFEKAASGRKRNAHHFKQLTSKGIGAYRQSVSFYHRCSELAYKKHHLTLYHDEKTTSEIERLRQTIRELRANLN